MSYAKLNDGVIELYSASGNYVSGTIMSNLQITVESGISKTYTVAKSTSTTTPITFTSDVNAVASDKISAFITLPSDKTIIIPAFHEFIAVNTYRKCQLIIRHSHI